MFTMQKFSKISNNTGIRSRANSGTRTGTPDRIYYNKDKVFSFNSKNARAFIYFTKISDISFLSYSVPNNDFELVVNPERDNWGKKDVNNLIDIFYFFAYNL